MKASRGCRAVRRLNNHKVIWPKDIDRVCKVLKRCCQVKCELCISLPLVREYCDYGQYKTKKIKDGGRYYNLMQSKYDLCPCPFRVECTTGFDKVAVSCQDDKTNKSIT